MLFGTTGQFLERLGLASLDDLPPIAPLLPDAALLEAELRASSVAPLVELVETQDGGFRQAQPAVAQPTKSTMRKAPDDRGHPAAEGAGRGGTGFPPALLRN